MIMRRSNSGRRRYYYNDGGLVATVMTRSSAEWNINVVTIMDNGTRWPARPNLTTCTEVGRNETTTIRMKAERDNTATVMLGIVTIMS